MIRQKDHGGSGLKNPIVHNPPPCLQLGLALLLLLDLEEQSTVDAGQDTTERDSGTDEAVQLFVTADGELQVTRRDTLDLQILGGVAGQFQYFSGQVLEDSSHVHGGCRFVST